MTTIVATFLILILILTNLNNSTILKSSRPQPSYTIYDKNFFNHQPQWNKLSSLSVGRSELTRTSHKTAIPMLIKQEAIKLKGDLIIGGLFPMHEAASEPHFCGEIKEGRGIQRLEGMLYALDKINSDPYLLPNLTLGAHILDTCSSDTYALEQTMEFIMSALSTVDRSRGDYICEDGSSPKHSGNQSVIGVIGAASSPVSAMVANILRLFHIPQISYASTSVELSDKSRFEFFSRVVPPDNVQARVMVDIVKLFNWTYVSTIAEEGDYGEKGIESFKHHAIKGGICIAESAKIPRKAREEDFVKIIEQISSKSSAKGVVMFVDEDNLKKFLKAVKSSGKEGEFTWLASDSWGRKVDPVRQNKDAAIGAITILPKGKQLKGFDDYFKTLKPSTNTRNPWFKRFWEKHFNCLLDVGDNYFSHYGSKNEPKWPCTGNESLESDTTKYEQEGLVPHVVDAVYAMAHGIHNLLANRCEPRNDDNSKLNHSFWHPENSCIREPIKGQELLSFIRKVTFTGLQGMIVKFNKDGDPPARYDIYQYQRIQESTNHDGSNSSLHSSHQIKYRYDYVNIGDWINNSLNFNMSKLRWPIKSNNYQIVFSSQIPTSICSAECKKDEIRQVHQSQPCCWHCTSCRENERVFNLTSCQSCPVGYSPDETRQICTKLPVEYMKWTSPWTIIPAAIASIGMIATVFTVMTFIRFNETPIIMASGRELCYILLFGLMVCYVVSLLILSRPTVLICTFVRIGLCLGLCICYSAILTKTNRISRIFNRSSKNGLKRPSYTSPKSQLIICSCLVSIQLIFIIAWLIRDPPSVREAQDKIGGRKVLVHQCGISSVATAVSLIYNIVLIILCTCYAFKTRKIPDNFNETKYIVFTMYSTCIVWMAFIPIYFGTNNDFKIRTASLSTCISISAFVNLFCLFTPKLYICLFQPYKNTRHGGQLSGGSSNSTSNALRFTRPTSSGGCAAIIAATTQIVSSHQSAPTILIPEPSSGDVKTTSTTTNGEWNTPSPDNNGRKGYGRRVSDSSSNKRRLK